ncbi:hypothetical protein AMTRI_Chr08g162580 [Amborella trichopoda]
MMPSQNLIVSMGNFGYLIMNVNINYVKDVYFDSRTCSLRMYNSLVERCFNDCIDTFRRKSLDKQEDTCVRRCAEKFLKHSMRVGLRFAELNQGTATPD